MNIDQYEKEFLYLKEFKIRQENFIKALRDLCYIYKQDYISFYKYNPFLKTFLYDITIYLNDEEDIEDLNNEKRIIDNEYTLKENDNIYGKIVFPEKIDTINEYFVKNLIESIKRKKELEKDKERNKIDTDIFIISDNEKNANQIKEDLSLKIDINISIIKDLKSIETTLKANNKKSIIMYIIEDKTFLERDMDIIKHSLDNFIVLGSKDYELALFCGKLNIDMFFERSSISVDELKEKIIEISTKHILKNNSESKIYSFSGISGGVGTTLISMNLSKIISDLTNKKILFMDLNNTKTISNLFLNEEVIPEKNILDLVDTDNGIETDLKNGLIEVSKNFHYAVGIQNFTDREKIESEEFIEKLLSWINKVNNRYDYIFIDTGLASASLLNINIYSISKEIVVITEMNLPSISKLKSFYNLTKKTGLKDKITFIVNRYNSQKSLSENDVNSILNSDSDNPISLKYKIPNNFEEVGESFNNCELIKKETKFYESLKIFLENKEIIEKKEKKTKFSFNFLKKK